MPPDVREVIQDLDEKEFEEELNDEQREVMEDIWLKADEMGKKINVTYFSYCKVNQIVFFIFRCY